MKFFPILICFFVGLVIEAQAQTKTRTEDLIQTKRMSSGEWQCIETAVDHSGTLNEGCGAGVWACYLDMKRECENLNTHKKWSKTYRIMTGKCSARLSDCW